MTEFLSLYLFTILLFLLIAILYSSVGFGGGSSYLAVLAMSGLLYTEIKSIALLCNIVVVLNNVFLFIRSKEYPWKKTIPLVLFSVPMAFIGGYLELTQQMFFVVLGFTLLFAAVSMWFSTKIVVKPSTTKTSSIRKNAFIGGSIGFLSGLVGIGGGIFLAPILHLTLWDSPRKIAAASSFFILVNSLSGLSGQFMNSKFYLNWNLTLTLLVVVFLGSLIGNKLRNKLLSPILLKKGTALLIAYVSFQILIEHILNPS